MAYMPRKPVSEMTFAAIYPMYIAKVERKAAKTGRTTADLDGILTWLTGYDSAGLAAAVTDQRTLAEFFAKAPEMNPNAHRITGVICGMRVEDIADPLMQQIRWMDKLVDEVANGKKMESIRRE